MKGILTNHSFRLVPQYVDIAQGDYAPPPILLVPQYVDIAHHGVPPPPDCVPHWCPRPCLLQLHGLVITMFALYCTRGPEFKPKIL